MKRNQGSTLISVLTATIVLAIGSVMVMKAMKQVSTSSGQETLKRSVQTQVSQLLVQLAETGKKALTCTRVNASTLQCNTTLSMGTQCYTASGSTSNTVQFTFNSSPTNNVTFGCSTDSANSNWSTIASYGTVQGQGYLQNFVVCDDATIQAGNCPIDVVGAVPSPISVRRAAIASTYPGRFFRFLLTAQIPTGTNAIPLNLQSAFFVRNPTSLSGLVYQ